MTAAIRCVEQGKPNLIHEVKHVVDITMLVFDGDFCYFARRDLDGSALTRLEMLRQLAAKWETILKDRKICDEHINKEQHLRVELGHVFIKPIRPLLKAFRVPNADKLPVKDGCSDLKS